MLVIDRCFNIGIMLLFFIRAVVLDLLVVFQPLIVKAVPPKEKRIFIRNGTAHRIRMIIRINGIVRIQRLKFGRDLRILFVCIPFLQIAVRHGSFNAAPVFRVPACPDRAKQNIIGEVHCFCQRNRISHAVLHLVQCRIILFKILVDHVKNFLVRVIMPGISSQIHCRIDCGVVFVLGRLRPLIIVICLVQVIRDLIVHG